MGPWSMAVRECKHKCGYGWNMDGLLSVNYDAKCQNYTHCPYNSLGGRV